MENILRNLVTEELKYFDKKNIDMSKTQINLLHEKDDGFICVALKSENKFIQYHYKRDALENNIQKLLNIRDCNIYITPNSFFMPARKIENVRKLNALYIDLDYYNISKYESCSFQDMKEILEKHYFDFGIPAPSFLVNTGRGICIYWMIEPVPGQALPLWNAIERYLYGCLKDLGADSKCLDCTRLMRIAGSNNINNNYPTELYIYDVNYIYSLREIQNEYLPELSPAIEKNKKKKLEAPPGDHKYKKKKKKNKLFRLLNIYSLHYSRLKDIVKLQELREGMCRDNNGQLIKDSQRELMCFLYRYWSCCFTQDFEKSYEDMISFNNKFKYPLNENEIKNNTIMAEKAYQYWQSFISGDPIEDINKNRIFTGYNYTNKKLIELLNITDSEIKNLETIIDIKEKRSRFTKVRSDKRKDIKIEKDLLLMKEVFKLKEQNYSIAKIASNLDVSRKKVSLILNKNLP